MSVETESLAAKQALVDKIMRFQRVQIEIANIPSLVNRVPSFRSETSFGSNNGDELPHGINGILRKDVVAVQQQIGTTDDDTVEYEYDYNALPNTVLVLDTDHNGRWTPKNEQEISSLGQSLLKVPPLDFSSTMALLIAVGGIATWRLEADCNRLLEYLQQDYHYVLNHQKPQKKEKQDEQVDFPSLLVHLSQREYVGWADADLTIMLRVLLRILPSAWMSGDCAFINDVVRMVARVAAAISGGSRRRQFHTATRHLFDEAPHLLLCVQTLNGGFMQRETESVALRSLSASMIRCWLRRRVLVAVWRRKIGVDEDTISDESGDGSDDGDDDRLVIADGDYEEWTEANLSVFKEVVEEFFANRKDYDGRKRLIHEAFMLIEQGLCVSGSASWKEFGEMVYRLRYSFSRDERSHRMLLIDNTLDRIHITLTPQTNRLEHEFPDNIKMEL